MGVSTHGRVSAQGVRMADVLENITTIAYGNNGSRSVLEVLKEC